LVVGGSPGLTGAVCLAAKAALRAGAGLVRVAVPKSLNSIFEVKLTLEMSLPVSEAGGCLVPKAFKEIKTVLNKVDVLALGPGAGLTEAARKLMVEIIHSVDKPMVVDADAITAIASSLKSLQKRKSKQLIITPHYGEFSCLIKTKIDKIKLKRKELAEKFALGYNLTLVLKGSQSLVTNGSESYENTTGNPGMATAGAGDVLTGIIAALAAQGLSGFEAAKLGVYLHGLAGDLAAKDKTQNCLIASDLTDYLPQAFKSLQDEQS